MTPIVDYLSNFEHIAKAKLLELAAEAENQVQGRISNESIRLEQSRKLVKDYVRFRWIQYLSTVKAGPLSTEELSIGMTSFEVYYGLKFGYDLQETAE
ncbi:MAG TPA: hypothetical protein VK859_06170 [bacterium]|jgi:hypothetical protein|nr:hypothetical protein [bacterium]